MLNSSLPLDLTIEILLRIPFESILACKLVSKPLKNLINDPKFYNLYHNRCVALFAGGNGLYCLLTRYGAAKIAGGEFPPYKVHRIPIGLNKQSSKFNFNDFKLLSGSSNRIVCLRSPHTVFLFYNLFTGASYSVDGPLKSVEPEHRRPFFGFGYDRYADDYNIFEVYGTNPDNDILYFWIYSFRNRGWQSVYGYPRGSYEILRSQAARSFNGILHWVAWTRDRKLVILTFDLRTRAFGEIMLPRNANNTEFYAGGKVSELDGRLCYVYHGYCPLHPKSHPKVWVMEEYGVEESWTILVGDDHASVTSKFAFFQTYPILSYSRRGDTDGEEVPLLLFERHINLNDVRMLWYDMANKDYQAVDEDSWYRDETQEELQTMKRYEQ